MARLRRARRDRPPRRQIRHRNPLEAETIGVLVVECEHEVAPREHCHVVEGALLALLEWHPVGAVHPAARIVPENRDGDAEPSGMGRVLGLQDLGEDVAVAVPVLLELARAQELVGGRPDRERRAALARARRHGDRAVVHAAQPVIAVPGSTERPRFQRATGAEDLFPRDIQGPALGLVHDRDRVAAAHEAPGPELARDRAGAGRRLASHVEGLDVGLQRIGEDDDVAAQVEDVARAGAVHLLTNLDHPDRAPSWAATGAEPGNNTASASKGSTKRDIDDPPLQNRSPLPSCRSRCGGAASQLRIAASTASSSLHAPPSSMSAAMRSSGSARPSSATRRS